MRCLGICKSKDFFGLLFEYVEGGDLSDLVGNDDNDDNDDGDGNDKEEDENEDGDEDGDDDDAADDDAAALDYTLADERKKFGELNAPIFDKWENRLDICRQISSGMAFLHENKVVHFDIKPENILLELSLGQLKCKVLFIGYLCAWWH